MKWTKKLSKTSSGDFNTKSVRAVHGAASQPRRRPSAVSHPSLRRLHYSTNSLFFLSSPLLHHTESRVPVTLKEGFSDYQSDRERHHSARGETHFSASFTPLLIHRYATHTKVIVKINA